jgi:hypothetical protein
VASGPLRIVHPGSDQSLSVAALRVAVGEASHRSEGDWVALIEAGYRFPKLEPGERVDLDNLEVLVAFVSQRAERAAAMAVELHEGLVSAGVAEAMSRKEIVDGLARFVLGARQWLDTARRLGGAARVEVGAPSIDDPSIPGWRSGSD